MAVYLDASALVKLVVEEPESTALRDHLSQAGPQTSSALARVEVIRAARGPGESTADDAVAKARRVVAGLDFIVGIDRAVLDDAADLPPSIMRSLDAIHVASARQIHASLQAVVTYDLRMIEAAQAVGLPVASPGVDDVA